jgi:cob(I)alamin adenosyltransferase
MGSVRTAKAERRMKEKLQQEVSTAIHTPWINQLSHDFYIIPNYRIKNIISQF